jgi:hypothetical protein
MTTQIFPNQQNGSKSYWSTPAGKVGTIVGILGLGAIGYYLLPILSTIIWNTVNFGIACGVLLLLIYIFFIDKRILSVGKYLYDIFIKNTFGLIFKLDPFVIADDYLKEIENERARLYEKCTEVSGHKETIKAKIVEKQSAHQKEVDKAAAAKRSEDGMALANATRQMERLEIYIKQLEPLKDDLQRVEDYLKSVHKNSAYMIEDMRNDIALKKDLYKSVTIGNNALKSAMKIFNGDAEKRMLFEQSMEYLKDDIGSKLAGIKMAISCSSEFMESIDLENAAYEEAGLRKLEQYRPDLFQHKVDSQIEVGGTRLTTVSPGKYNNLLD